MFEYDPCVIARQSISTGRLFLRLWRDRIFEKNVVLQTGLDSLDGLDEWDK
jgi:hypothetical protein